MRGHIHTEHLLLALLMGDGSGKGALKSLGVDCGALEKACKDRCTRGWYFRRRDLPLTLRGDDIMAFAADEMRRVRSPVLSTGHVLLGMLLEPRGIAGDVLRTAGVTLEATREALRNAPEKEEAARALQAG